MAKYGMVIDLLKCTGCGACGLGCKTENNTQDRADGQTFNWADYHIRADGKYPNCILETVPVLCNHCTNAPCVDACPVTPKAMFKQDNGITMHNEERCIGCRLCQEACPYSAMDADAENAQYSVVSFNEFDKKAHPAYHNDQPLVKGMTTTGAEIAKKAGANPPHKTAYKHPEYSAVRRAGVTEKCIFCDHRVSQGLKPYCTVVCPSQARTFGDLDDPNSEASKLLKKYDGGRRIKNNKAEWLGKDEKGFEPNVYYVRTYCTRKA
jgi:Fe-S-cluster-containing dehydrogenase component